jgi:hypothetical protein
MTHEEQYQDQADQKRPDSLYDEHLTEEAAKSLSVEERIFEREKQNDPLLARVAELHEVLFQAHLLDEKELADIKKERQHYLQQAGKFEASEFLQIMGFSVSRLTMPGHVGDYAATLDIDGKQLKIYRGFGNLKDKLTIKWPGMKSDLEIPVASSPDELYAALDEVGLKLSTLTWHRKRAQYETTYIKSKKQ